MKTLETDFLVIGSGLAGLWFTYKVKDFGKVILVTKKDSAESNTNYAQGGIAAALGEDDSPEIHFQDTMKAGEGLAKEEIVRMVVETGPELVKELFSLGVDFSTYYNSYGKLRFDLGREGGHSRRRIVHARDYTGMAIEETLLSLLKEKKGIEIRPRHFVLDLIVE
ncbi:MAG: FAD-binding protein, partial [candidate division WOR-3 bacterium]